MGREKVAVYIDGSNTSTIKTMIPLDKNESYWLLDEPLRQAAITACKDTFSTYPNYAKLKQALAAYVGVTPEQIFVTPGSDAAIEHIVRAYVGVGEALLPIPTFYGYESILDHVGATTVPIAYKERDRRFVFPCTQVLDALARGSAKALFLCQPNNPLGCSLSSDDIASVAGAVRGSSTLLVSDEAYFEFSSGTSCATYLAGLPNLIIVRTLSKAFGLAGARVGYGIAAPAAIKQIEKDMLPWATPHPSIEAACALLAREPAVRARRALVCEAREAFFQRLRALKGLTAYPSETNFVLVRVAHADYVAEKLHSQGIHVARGDRMSRFHAAKELLVDTLRIAIPEPRAQDAIIQALADTVG